MVDCWLGRIQSQARNGYLIYNCKFADKVPVITVVVMSEPCISKSAHNYNYFLHDPKEELQLYGTATSNSKQDLRNQRTEGDAG